MDFLLRDDLTPELVPELTHYEILGFEKYGNGVGDEGLKKAYRKAVLKYHPDKTGVQDGEEDEVGAGFPRVFESRAWELVAHVPFGKPRGLRSPACRNCLACTAAV